MSTSFHTIVIGAGHNGLTCAAYLARAGQRVLVLEARDIPGGFTTTEATIPLAPGFLFSVAALDMATGNIPPSFVDELQLERYGLRWIELDPFYSHISPDGASLAFWRDYRRTCQELERFSRRDAERYATLTEILRDVWITAAPYLMGHPRRPTWSTIWSVATRALRRRRHLSRATRILLSAPGALIEEWFESSQLRAALGCFALGGVVPIDEPAAGLILSVMALQHEWGVRRPIGGMGALTNALIAEVEAHNGTIRTSDRVETLLHAEGRVIGVATRSGAGYRAAQIVGAIDPHTLFGKLVPQSMVDDQLRTELKGMGVGQSNFAAFRIDVALDRSPQLVTGSARGRELLPSSMLLAADFDCVRRTSRAVGGGEVEPDFPVWIAVPSALDRSLVPTGCLGDGLYIFVPAVPLNLRGGQPWSDRRQFIVDSAMAAFERIAPGVSEHVIGTAARSPDDIAATSGAYRGHAFHVDMCVSQLGPWRPTPSLAGYRSPIPGLWHTGAGAHPMGTVCGWPGRAAAQALINTST
jgi:beta-carotene ketolase (CrtO type)